MAEMEYERREDLRSEGKKVCLVLRSQESKLGVVRIRSQMRRLILDYTEELGM